MTKEEKIKELEEIYKDDRFLLRSELINLEHNNGWIKIESEDDLPKEEGLYFTMRRDKTKVEITHFFYELSKEFKKVATHYQPIEKPKEPIY